MGPKGGIELEHKCREGHMSGVFHAIPSIQERTLLRRQLVAWTGMLIPPVPWLRQKAEGEQAVIYIGGIGKRMREVHGAAGS